MLISVEIARFKSIEASTLPFGRMMALVGPNNAGKSSVLQAIQFATSVCQSLEIDNVSQWRSGIRRGTLSTQQLIYTPLRELNALAFGGSLRQEVASAIEVTLVDDILGTSKVSVRRGKNKNISITIDGQPLGEQLQDLDAPFSVFAPGLAGIPSVEEYRAPGIVRRAAARGDANSVFRNVLWTLSRDEDKWNTFLESLRTVFPDVAVTIIFNEHTDQYIDVAITRAGVSLPIDSAGTGVLQAVQILSYVGAYEPRLLLLDEPDSHLHPDNQRKLARLLGNLTESSGLQVLLSTHSRHFLDELAHVDTTLHWFSSGGIREGEFNQVAALLELGALDAGDRLRNGHTSLVVLTEDSRTRNLETLLLSAGLSQDAFTIWSYNGCTELKAAALLADFIRRNAPGTRVLVHRDRDYLSDAQVDKIREDLLACAVDVFITDGTDVESCFLDLDYLTSLYPDIDSEVMQGLVDEATADLREYSCETMITDRVDVATAIRRTGGEAPRAGRISTQAYEDFDAIPQRFRHGKKTLKRLRTLIQERGMPQRAIGANPSPFLSVDVIARLAISIAGSTSGTRPSTPPAGSGGTPGSMHL